MRERDLKTGQFKRGENHPTITTTELKTILRGTIKEYLDERKKTDTDLDTSMSIVMKACASLLLFFAAVFIAARIW